MGVAVDHSPDVGEAGGPYRLAGRLFVASFSQAKLRDIAKEPMAQDCLHDNRLKSLFGQLFNQAGNRPDYGSRV